MVTSAAAVCWVCGSANAVLWKPRAAGRRLAPGDLDATDGTSPTTLTLWRCRACSFVYADGEDVAELAALCGRAAEAPAERSSEAARQRMRYAIRAARAVHPGARTVLGAGAGADALLAEAERVGLSAAAADAGRAIVRRGGGAAGDPLVAGAPLRPAPGAHTFDVVCLLNVLECVDQPVELLRAAAAALAPGGVVLVITPDVDSVAARRLRGQWWHFRIAHVGYFNARSLARAARRAGLGVAYESRALSYCRVGELADHAALFFPPLRWANWLAVRLPPLRWLYDRVTSVDLRDSLLAVLAPAADPAPTAAGAAAVGAPAEPRHDLATPERT